MTIPLEELARLHACVRDAWGLAEVGRVLEGYELLELGLVWAETPALNPLTGEQSPPNAWSAALIGLYRHELMRYSGKHRPLGERGGPSGDAHPSGAPEVGTTAWDGHDAPLRPGARNRCRRPAIPYRRGKGSVH